jgi:hypothetical protein
MMRNKIILFILLAFGMLLFLSMGALAARPDSYSGKASFAKVAQDKVTRSLSNINNWSYWQYHDGTSGIEPAGASGGGIYPRGTGNVVFQDGLVWGTIVNDKIQVGGATYNTGTQPGWIRADGTSDPNDARARIYRIRSDWRTLTDAQVVQDAAEVNVVLVSEVTTDMTQAIITQYKDDWLNWPTDLGAPFVDKNENGIYEPVLDADGYATTEGDYPGFADGDQVMWYVVNDLDPAAVSYLYGADPIGMELQVTIWGYNQPAARLGQLIFIRKVFINKSNNLFDSMYVAQWCDPDVGASGNDLVGCDSVLGIGFAYNSTPTDGTFDEFGLVPPAGGYDFFQGPLLVGEAGQDRNKNGVDDAEDYGIRNLKKVGPGLINLPMTSFGYFSAGNQEWDDPDLQEYDGSLQWYNLLRGNITNINVTNPTPFTHRGTGKETKWPLNGDPVAGTGDIDGTGANFAAADRRFALCSGPFEMAPGDTQEVVVVLIGGISSNYLASVTDLKLNDQIAQTLFDNLFAGIPKAPAPPDVKAYASEEGIVLNWGYKPSAVAATENTAVAGYAFEGYNVYQLPSQNASQSQATRIATFDLVNGVQTVYGKVFDPSYGEEITVPVQFGLDKGVQRYFVVDKNYITGTSLFPGNTYYFAVTAYNYNENPQLIESKALESPLTGFPVTTQSPPPGVRYESEIESELTIEHSAGVSDGQVAVMVVDPSAVTGDDYEISFVENTDSTIAPVGEFLFNVRNVTMGVDKATNQQQNTSIDANRGPIVDGLLIKVAGPAKDFKSFQVVANAAGPIDPPEMGCFAFNANGFPFLFNSLYPPPDGTDRPDGTRQQTNGSTWGVHTGMNSATMDPSYDYFKSRVARNDNFDRIVPYDFEMRFTAAGGYANWAFEVGGTYHVPFELWCIGIGTPDDDSDDYRMVPWVLNDIGDEADGDTVYNINADDHSVSGGTNDPYMDWVYWCNPVNTAPGTAGYDQFVVDALAETYDWGSPEVMARTVLVNWNGGDVLDATFPANCDAVIPEEGTIFRVISNKPNSVADKFTFTSTEVLTDRTTAKEDVVDKITVYPNPYYAFNEQEPDRFTRFITFYHLPPRTVSAGNPFATKTIIRIFDLGGSLVRKLEKTDNSQFMRWDLRNSANLPVASGIYIAHIDMPDLGAEKVLKIFIVQPAQILRFY